MFSIFSSGSRLISLQNPWGSPPGGGNPWGNGGGRGRPPSNRGNGGGGMQPPDLEEMLRRLGDSFGPFWPGNFNALRAALLALMIGILLWLGSGFYFIQPNENAVVLTFGKYTRTEDMSGLKYALPWPIQGKFKVDVTTERRTEIGFSTGGGFGAAREVVQQTIPGESLMLTGDENIIDINFVVLWRVGDAKNYLFEIRNPEETVKMVAESAMRETIGQTKIQSALTEARGKVQSDTKALMQKILDDFKSGVTINNVQLLKVDPPTQVIDAFNDVQRARAEAERMRNEAHAYRNDVLPRARGESQKKLEEAEADKQEAISRAKGDADRFTSVYTAYEKSKDVTTERLYIEAVESILQNAKTIIMDGGDKGQGILPYLPIDTLRRAPKAAPDSSGSLPQPPSIQ